MNPYLLIALRHAHSAIEEILEKAGSAKPLKLFKPPKEGLTGVADPRPMKEPVENTNSIQDSIVPPGTIPVGPTKPDVELDSEGLPWDKRIHSGGKTFMKKDGTWKLRRKLDPVFVAKVKSELLIAQNPERAADIPGNDVPPPPPQVNEVPTPPPVEDTPTVVDPNAFMKLMTAVTGAGLSAEAITEACRAHGLADIGELHRTPEKILAVATELGLEI